MDKGKDCFQDESYKHLVDNQIKRYLDEFVDEPIDNSKQGERARSDLLNTYLDGVEMLVLVCIAGI